jgi:hypothetical protein
LAPKSNSIPNPNASRLLRQIFLFYVAYNRLYFELGISYVRMKIRKGEKIKYVSDAKSAKDYVISFLGAGTILKGLTDDKCCWDALDSIIKLIDNRVFAIKLDELTRERNAKADLALIEKLKSNSAYEKVYGVLDTIYSIRCNMFHGQKGYEPVQIDLLIPVTTLLKKVMDLLFTKMNQVKESNWW